MNPTDELYHSVLQKLIILFLSLLTVSVILTSCTSAAKSCAAYNGVEVHEHEQTTER